MSLKLWDNIDEEFQLYGIKSNGLEEHKFVFKLNQTLNFSFVRDEDLDVTIKKETFCFSLYSYYNELTDNDFFLIKNLSHSNKDETNTVNSLFDTIETKRYLLNKYKIFDYLFKIQPNADNVKLIELSLINCTFIRHIKVIEKLNQTEKKSLLI